MRGVSKRIDIIPKTDKITLLATMVSIDSSLDIVICYEKHSTNASNAPKRIIMDTFESNDEVGKRYKRFTFIALVKTGVGAIGYLHGNGYLVCDGKIVVNVGSRSFAGDTVKDILTLIGDSYCVKFLESNVEDTCICEVRDVKSRL